MNVLDAFFHYYGAVTAVIVFIAWLVIKLTLMHIELRKMKSLLEQLIKQKSVQCTDQDAPAPERIGLKTT